MAEEKRDDPGKALKEKSMHEFAERTKGKPTPTQDELNRINLGEHVELEADGSNPDEHALSPDAQKKQQSEARPGGQRQPNPQQQTPPRRPNE
jgi:hypothetical protein